MVPLDLDRNSVQNGCSFVSGALMATPFVPKFIFREPVKNPEVFSLMGKLCAKGFPVDKFQGSFFTSNTINDD